MAAAVFGASNVKGLQHSSDALQELIEGVDAIDNGVNISASGTLYSVKSDLGSRVKRLNPNWNEPASEEIYDVRSSSAG